MLIVLLHVVIVVVQIVSHLPELHLLTGPLPGQTNGGHVLEEKESILQRLILFSERTNLIGQWRQEGPQPAEETRHSRKAGRPSAPLGLSLITQTVV